MPLSEKDVLDRQKLSRRWSKKILKKLDAVLPSRPVEADFRRAVEPLLDGFCEEAHIDPLVHAEYTLATGRADTIFNRLVIEWKRPGVLKKSIHSTSMRGSIEKVRGYIIGLAEKEHREVHRLAGVIFDGQYFVFLRLVNRKWSEEAPVEVNEYSLERFLAWLTSLSSGIALTAEKLKNDFSVDQPHAREILVALFQGLMEGLADETTIVARLFEQWRSFFSESIDYSEAFGGRKLEGLKAWVKKAGLEVRSAEEAEPFMFALHTYFALLVKFLAWLALSRHLAVKLGAPSFGELISSDSEALHRNLEEMESGGIFRKYRIINLLEGDLFSWYIYAWNQQIEDALRGLLTRLGEYDPATLAVVPEETRDLFKKLYHYLLPRRIRHNLGEYYTPDWLAQRLLNQIDNEFFAEEPRRSARGLRKKLLTKRWLDPACGSGTFLVLIITQMRVIADALVVNESELLDQILQNVVGFDLNPLAVLTARVNYLLQVSDLLESRKGDVNIPVYLADTVRTPTIGKDIFARGAYDFVTSVGTFLIPPSLCSKERFDRFCDMLDSSVRADVGVKSFVHSVETKLGLDPPEWSDNQASIVARLYESFLELHRAEMNGLWARLLRNNLAPLTVGLFDCVVGNPPWVNWESLPDHYRRAIVPIWVQYGLFPHRGMDTILGKGKKDIAMLMTYTVCDTLLRKGGRLGFVITQTVFKTTGAGQGFRQFSLLKEKNSRLPLGVIHVDDMVDLNPFEGASNRTSVLILEKGKETRYPVPYTIWRRKSRVHFTYDSTLPETTDATRRLRFRAEPVQDSDITSSWITARPGALRAFRKVLGKSQYEARAGSYSGGVNAVYWLNIVTRHPDGSAVVQNITSGARVQVEQVVERVESDLLFPLLRGRDVERWKAQPSAFILVVQDPDRRCGIEEAHLQEQHPCTYAYLKRFEEVLKGRAAFRRYFTRRDKNRKVTETAPFYSMFNIGKYTFAPWKVVWREQASTMTAAVVGSCEGKIVVPDHKLMLVPCRNSTEAHYLCALLNSKIVRSTVLAYAVQIQMDPHILDHISVPAFVPADETHLRLARLSMNAHKMAQQTDSKGLTRVESEIDSQAAGLWGLTDRESGEILGNLRELTDRV